MRELADSGSHGAHRLPLVDLTVTVAAQAAGLNVLHYGTTSLVSAICLGSERSGSPTRLSEHPRLGTAVRSGTQMSPGQDSNRKRDAVAPGRLGRVERLVDACHQLLGGLSGLLHDDAGRAGLRVAHALAQAIDDG